MAKEYEDEKEDDGLDGIVSAAKNDPRMKELAGDKEEGTDESEDEDESADSVEDCLNEAFDKRNDREGFVNAMKRAIGGY